MVLQTSGPIKLSDIQIEFGDSSPVSMSEHYRAGSLVPDINLNIYVPTSGTINISDFYGSSVSTFSITPSSTSVDEGDTVTFNITASNYSGDLYWRVDAAGDYPVSDSDFSSPSTVVSEGGTVSFTNNSASVSFTLSEDSLTEGIEYFRLKLVANSRFGLEVASSSLITVNDTSQESTYSLSGPTSVSEGNTLTINLTTSNVPDGTVLGYTISGINADDLSSGSLTGSFTVNSNSASVTLGIAQDSTSAGGSSKLYVGGSTNYIRSYNLSDPITGSTALNSNIYNVYQRFISFKPDGTKVYYSDTDKVIYESPLLVPFDVGAGLSGPSTTRTISESGSLGSGTFSAGGTRFFWCDGSGRKIFEHNLSTSWDISTLSPSASEEWTINLPSPGLYRGLSFDDTGQYIYLLSSQYRKIYMYETPSAYKIGPSLPTIISPGAIDLNSSDPPRDLSFNVDGTRMYVSYDTYIDQYNLTTAWDLFSSSYNSSLDISSVETGADGIFVRSDLAEGDETLTLSLDNGADSIDVTVIDVV